MTRGQLAAVAGLVCLALCAAPASGVEPAGEIRATPFAPETIGGPKCFCPTFSPDRRTVVFVKANVGLVEARLEGGRWGEARPLPFSGSADFRDGDPFFSPDGSRLFFWSTRPLDGMPVPNSDLWVVERRGEGWGVPRNLGPPVNNRGGEPFPAVAADGTLYFGSVRPCSGAVDLYRARPSGSGYAEPENLGPEVNSPHLDLDGCISPDQRTLVFASDRPGGHGKFDLYVSHWREGRWSPARNLGPAVNGPGDEFCPHITDEGRLLFSRDTPDGGMFEVSGAVLGDPSSP
jgi:Tol biopolymer transport system component